MVLWNNPCPAAVKLDLPMDIDAAGVYLRPSSMWLTSVFWSMCVLARAQARCVTVGGGDDVSDGAMMRLPPGPVPTTSHRRIFYDDFNTLDRSQWVPDASASQSHGSHYEFEIYSPEDKNCYVRDGVFYLRPTLTADRFGESFLHTGKLDVKKLWGRCYPFYTNGCYRDAAKDGIMPPVLSCGVRSKFVFKYGRVEIKAQMSKGDWLWPALWLLPKYPSPYGGWPTSGEIDIVEALGNVNYGKLGLQRTTASLHFGASAEYDKHLMGQYWLHGETYGDRFFNYVMDWTPDHMKFYVDNVLIYAIETPSNGMHAHYGLEGENPWGTSKNAPFDHQFYLIMNVAVGGTRGFFTEKVINYPHPMPWSRQDTSPVAMEKFWRHKNDWFPTWNGEGGAMKVDSVTVWSYD